MPVVLISPEGMRNDEGEHTAILRDAGFEIRYPQNPIFTRGHGGEPETIDELKGCSAVIAGGEVFGESALASLPELRVISRSGVGYDRVDVAAASRHSVVLTITPTANHEAVAEHALALIFAVAKEVVTGDGAGRAGRWPMNITQPVREATLGLMGLGRIGRSLAIRAAALRMKVIATEPFPNQQFVQEHGIELVDFEQLLARSDYLSVHCPLTEETRGLFDRSVFAKMKPGSALINTARGGLVKEADLCEALERGHLRGAGLDVFEQEPPSPDNPLFQLEQVVVSPHIASNDWLSQNNMGIEAAQNIVRLYRGEWPAGAVVNEELRMGWSWNR